ncbi:MAG: ABC transporter substrate-binding protein [Actinobacteria bacterium]|nr:ABC transporter substrate-binding protein [Actinomycetota bacterium]
MRAFSRALPALAAAALAISLAACGSQEGTHSAAGPSSAAATFPVTLTTANGPVKVKARPHAIISLSPAVTEMLYAIGAGRQVKAVDSDSDYPPQAPRTKLSGLQPNVEAIAADKPDLVVASYGAASLAKHMAAFGVPVLDLPAPSTLSDVYSQFTLLGKATGHLAAAQHEDTSLRSQLTRIAATVPHHSPPVTYYYELDPNYYSLTSSTFVGRLLGMLGMKSIADGATGAAAAGGYPQLSAEYVLKAHPDYVILADTICCHQTAATVAKRPGWAALSAVRSGHVIALNDDIASRWGPRIVTLLRTVANAVKRQ